MTVPRRDYKLQFDFHSFFSSLHSTLYSILHSSFYLISNCVLTWIMHCATKPREPKNENQWSMNEKSFDDPKKKRSWKVLRSELLPHHSFWLENIFTCVTSQFIHCALITQSNLDQRHERSMLMGLSSVHGWPVQTNSPFPFTKEREIDLKFHFNDTHFEPV